jgi:hypothetical protein
MTPTDIVAMIRKLDGDRDPTAGSLLTVETTLEIANVIEKWAAPRVYTTPRTRDDYKQRSIVEEIDKLVAEQDAMAVLNALLSVTAMVTVHAFRPEDREAVIAGLIGGLRKGIDGYKAMGPS